MYKVVNVETNKEIIKMSDMRPLQVGRVSGHGEHPYKGDVVMRTASTSHFEVMNLSHPETAPWGHKSNHLVELLKPGEVVTIQIFN